ncbi:MAG: hypothetical protein HY457_01035 [Parcubacteria group bacterium]|nr:hypothetical protein [Parcubacteria group bacterium]
MLDFWEARMRHERIFLYSLAPFLEEAGILLLGGHHLWHSWSLNRREELLRIAHELKGRAKLLRKSGLAWACNVSAFGESGAAVLSSASHYRYHPNEGKLPICPDALPYMVGMATEILFVLLGVLEKAEKDGHADGGHLEWLSRIIETLTEAPYSRPVTQAPEALLETLSAHAVLLECEGLAYAEATIEDSFNRKDPKRRRKKQSPFSDEKLRELASEFGMPFEVVKEIFETESSSWWDKATYFKGQASEAWETIISSLPADGNVKTHIQIAWDVGGTAQDARPECWGEDELRKSESVIQALISSFLYQISKGEMERFRTLLGTTMRKTPPLLNPPLKLLEGPKHKKAQ